MQETTDHQRMLAVRDGDLDELGHLFETYHRQLYGYFKRQLNDPQLSEDLVQEVFFRILKFRRTYRGEGQFRTWLYSIAYNTKIDFLRRKQRRPETTDSEIDRLISSELNPEEVFDRLNRRELFDQALAQLDKPKREVLVLRRYQNLKYTEIAEILNCPVGTVKARLFNAVKDIKSFLSKQGVEVSS